MRVENVELAIAVAEQLRDAGEFDWFRGQLMCWPLVPSLTRCDEADRQVGEDRFDTFMIWANATDGVQSMLADFDHVKAVAQHYGIPTDLIDFSTEPAIAGFFASHSDAAPPVEPTESCIYCLNSDKARSAAAVFGEMLLADAHPAQALEIPELITIDVDNLWRLQAQHGVFLRVPWDQAALDTGLLESVLDLLCIVFPYSGPTAHPPAHLVYPDRRSALEVLLDEFFHRERDAAAEEWLQAHGFRMIGPTDADTARHCEWLRPEVRTMLDLSAKGAELEIFADAAPPAHHRSWSDAEISSWVTPSVEYFRDVVGCEHQTVLVERIKDPERLIERCTEGFADLLASGTVHRNRAVRWRVVDRITKREIRPRAPGNPEPRDRRKTVGKWIDFAWDGLRALPYSDDEVALALGTSVASLAWEAFVRSEDEIFLDYLWADRAAIDLVSPTGGDTFAFVAEHSLLATLRPDLARLLAPEWRALAGELWKLLSVIGSPPHLMHFQRWRRLFASQIVPSQIADAPEVDRDWIIFNPTQVNRIRHH